MFASRSAKPKAKAAGTSNGKAAQRRPALAGQRLDHDPVEQALFAQRTIANQAPPRFPARRDASLARNGHDSGLENPVERSPTPRGISREFSEIALFPPACASEAQPSMSPVARRVRSAVQAKLVIGESNDPLEQEADRVADHVMRTPDPAPAIRAASRQVGRKCAACEEEAPTTLQTRRAAGSTQTTTPDAASSVYEVLRAPGLPLDAATRNFFEPRFRYDFSGVRVHSDTRAARSAKAIGALAYAVGRNIVFGAGAYAPRTSKGQRLLAHEMAHVVQQSGASPLSRRSDMNVASTVADSGVAALRPTASKARLVARRVAPVALGPAGPDLLVQRACDYDAAEKAKLAGGDRVLAREVQLMGAIRSGYNASSDSVVVADFPPGSAVVRGAAAAELNGSWKGILERSTKAYALLGFSDCVTGEKSDPKLRAARAQAVANLLPTTARRASVIGAAPANDYLKPANANAQERALNRSVLIRLHFEELREIGEVDDYAAGAIRFWRSKPTATVGEMIDAVVKEASDLLDRNGIYKPDVVKATITQGATMAFFDPKLWSVTVDGARSATGVAQPGLTPSSKMSELKIESVTGLASTIYHEFRHAEQSFLSARAIAETAGQGQISPKELADQLDVPIDVAAAAILAASGILPDNLKAKASAWRTFEHGGRYVAYKQWNEGLKDDSDVFIATVNWNDLAAMPPGQIQASWKVLHPFIDKIFRRKYYWTADDLLRAIKSGPREPVDADVERVLKQTVNELFKLLSNDRDGAKLSTPAQIAKMSPTDANLAALIEQDWLLKLQIGLLQTHEAADDAYRAYPEEFDAYETGDLVKASGVNGNP